MNDYDHETGIDNSRPPKLSKSAKKANLRAEPHYDEVNVLVTGFGVSTNLSQSRSLLSAATASTNT